MPESENGAILWALIRILTTLLGRFKNLFDRPVNQYSPYLKVKCSTFQQGISRNFGVMEGFNGFDKKKNNNNNKKRRRVSLMNAYRQISKKACSKKMLIKLSRNVWRKDKILSIYKYQSTHQTGLRFIASVRSIMYERLLFQLGGGREACQVLSFVSSFFCEKI